MKKILSLPQKDKKNSDLKLTYSIRIIFDKKKDVPVEKESSEKKEVVVKPETPVAKPAAEPAPKQAEKPAPVPVVKPAPALEPTPKPVVVTPPAPVAVPVAPVPVLKSQPETINNNQKQFINKTLVNEKTNVTIAPKEETRTNNINHTILNAPNTFTNAPKMITETVNNNHQKTETNQTAKLTNYFLTVNNYNTLAAPAPEKPAAEKPAPSQKDLEISIAEQLERIANQFEDMTQKAEKDKKAPDAKK